MAGVTGREAKFAFAKFGANSWGVAASVTKGAYIASTGGLKLQPARVNDEAMGQAFLGSGDLGDVEAPDLVWTGRSRFNDHLYIWDALAMGSPSAATLVTSAAAQVASYSHVLDLAPTIDGLGLTAAFEKVRFVQELTSAKIYGFSEAVGDGGVMDRSYKIIGSKPTNISSINVSATITGASFPELGNRVMRNQGVFRINLQSGNSLVAADAVKVETVEFSFERPQDAPHVFGQDFVDEPADNGFPEVKVVLQFPRMTATSADSLEAAMRNNTKWKADWKFLGAFINSTDRFMRYYEFPQLELDEYTADIEGPNQVKPQATYTAKMAATSPANMPVVNPFRLTIINAQAANAFA